MTLEELIETYPEAETYFKNMPEELKTRYTIRKFPPGTIIHQKDYPLDYFGIVCSGDHRVINEFENGNVFMIEKNEAIDFIGEVNISVSGLYAEICFHPQYREEGRSYPSENERRNPGRTGHDCKNHQPNHHKTERRRPY